MGSGWDPKRCVCSVSPAKAVSVALVGSIPSGASPYGCLDMAGNVLEWCSGWYDGGCKFPQVRGGAWDHRIAVNFHARRRFWFSPNSKFSSRGFRCVLPEGSS